MTPAPATGGGHGLDAVPEARLRDRPTSADITAHRLRSSRLAGNPMATAEAVVGWLCAVQAQDYAAAKWAIAQRARGVTDSAIDRLLTEGKILRTHVLRPTWHFVLPDDIRWLLHLSRPRVKAALAYHDRVLDVDQALVARSNAALIAGLRGGARLVRAEIVDLLSRHGIGSEGLRLGHLLMHAELDAVICSGGVRGRQFTYALLDECAGEGVTPSGDAAIAALASRYLAGHGPALLGDFAWWSGLTIRQARRGMETATPGLRTTALGQATYWSAATTAPPRRTRPRSHIVSNFDEYLVGYADRGLHLGRGVSPTPGLRGELLANSILVGGRIVGGWSRAVTADSVTVTARPRVALPAAQRADLERLCLRYGEFLERPARLVWEEA